MKHLIYYLLVMVMAVGGFSSCSDDDEVVPTSGYGYIQLHIVSAQTRGMVEGGMLDSLAQARKVRLSLRQQDSRVIEQTLNLASAEGESARYGLTSENLRIRAGEYQLISYAIYGEYNGGYMAPILQVCEPDEPLIIRIEDEKLTRQELTLQALEYGKLQLGLVRLEPETRAGGAPQYGSEFNFADTDSLLITFGHEVGGTVYRQQHRVKASKCDSDVPMFDVEELLLQTGHYTLSHIELYNRYQKFLYAQDLDLQFTIVRNEETRSQIGIQLPLTQGISDGIALRKIWEEMDGPSWNWHELDGNAGANWIFTLTDGSPRPISAWTKQVGVVVMNGRVVSLNLGSFNPRGEVPEAIGQLTALEKLYLGMHTDEIYYQLEGVGDVHYQLNPWVLGQTDQWPANRMAVARERTTIRRMQEDNCSFRTSRLLVNGKSEMQQKLEQLRYAQDISTYGQYTSDPANRITGIHEAIGKLTNLQELYIANTLIKKLPLSLQNLTNLTDLELFNNPFEDVDGEIFKNMHDLTSVNFDSFYRMSQEQIHAMINKMCTYCQKLQLLYMNRMGLTKLPERLNYLTDLRLLDVNFNKITEVKSLKPMAPIQLMMNNNLLETIPADFINNADLELFSVKENHLKEFPAVLSNLDGLYTISEIDLTGNQIRGFQSGWHGIRVEQLKLEHNQMGLRSDNPKVKGMFPTEFSDYGSEINYLVLSGNHIDTITNAAVANIKYISALNLAGNNLVSLPSYFNAEHFPYLTGLDLSNNCFCPFPENVLNITSLSQLLISAQGYYMDEAETHWHRCMTSWPEYLHLHSGLTNLDVSGNDFRTVTNFPTNLTTLNVRDNPHIRMTVPQQIIYRMSQGLFYLYYDEGQDIKAE